MVQMIVPSMYTGVALAATTTILAEKGDNVMREGTKTLFAEADLHHKVGAGGARKKAGEGRKC
jgi:hypothetical protein